MGDSAKFSCDMWEADVPGTGRKAIQPFMVGRNIIIPQAHGIRTALTIAATAASAAVRAIFGFMAGPIMFVPIPYRPCGAYGNALEF